MPDITPIQLTMSVTEATCWDLWARLVHKAKHPKPGTTPTDPPPQPKSIPMTGVICAHRTVYWQTVGARHRMGPAIVEGEERLLRATGSEALGVNSYLFAGEVVACERRVIEFSSGPGGHRHGGEWHLNYVVDSGIPLHMSARGGSAAPEATSSREGQIHEGVYIEGITRLFLWDASNSVHQTVSGEVVGMRMLDLDPRSESFGKVRPTPWGEMPSADPDVVPVDIAFVDFVVHSVGEIQRREGS